MSIRQDLRLPPNVEPIVEEIPPLLDEQVDVPGVVVGVVSTDPDEPFTGADVEVSKDGGDTFDSVQSFRSEAVVGHVVGTFGGGVTGRFWDTKNTLRIQLMRTNDELSSEPEEAVFAGRRNVLLVGKEVVGFVTATAVEGELRTWDLTKLSRGRRNTEEFIDLHAENEQVLLLTTPSVLQFVSLPLNSVSPSEGRSDNLLFRSSAGGLPITDSTYQKKVAFEAKNVKEFAPTVLPAVRDTEGNIRVRWVNRSKRPFRLFAPIKDDRLACCGCMQYEIDILSADRTAVLRRYTVLNRTDFVYTAARQIEDFGSVQATVEVNIYKSAQMVGRGRTVGGSV